MSIGNKYGWTVLAGSLAIGIGLALGSATYAATTKPQRVTVTGEIMDSWCYISGVMGSPEATLGAAHHTCAMWCAAGGIPVGLRTVDGEVYMVLVLEGKGTADGNPTFLDLQSETVTADGLVYERDGMKYLVVEKILSNEGIAATQEDYGLTPPFAIPQKVKDGILAGGE